MKKYAWEEVYRKEGYALKAPDPLVVKFAENTKKHHTGRVLDLGSGLGRHIPVFSQNNFFTVGLDISFTALELSKRLLGEGKEYLVRADMEFIPFRNETFDIVLAWRVLHMGNKKKLDRTFAEIERILKRGGKLFASIRSRRNILYLWGRKHEREIEEGTLKIERLEEIKGAIYHFFSKDELLSLLKNFEITRFQELPLEHTSYTERLGGENWFYIIEAWKK